MDPMAGAATYNTSHRHALIQYYQHDPQGWLQWSDQLNNQVADQSSMDSALDSLCRLTQLKVAALPTAPSPQVTSLHRDTTWTKGVASMWGHYRAMKQLRGQSVQHVFRAWKHWCQFHRASQRFRKEAKRRKQALVDEFLQEAGDYAMKGDASQWYRRVRVLCPKNKLERIHLRAAEGVLLSPEMSIQALEAYYTELFHDSTYVPSPIPALSAVPFSRSEIESAILQLPLRKAVLPGLPPAIAWHAAACSLAADIRQTLQQCWCEGPCILPADWYRSAICLLPKPG